MSAGSKIGRTMICSDGGDDGDDRLWPVLSAGGDSRGESSRNLTNWRIDSPSIGSNRKLEDDESKAERRLERQMT